MREEAHGLTPTIYARQLDLQLRSELGGVDLKDRLKDFLSEVSKSLQKDGAVLIGHIKGMLDCGMAGSLFFSLTNFEGEPDIEGQIGDNFSEARLVINVIVFGVEQRSCENAVEQGLERHLEISIA
jgi:hypothetical protein